MNNWADNAFECVEDGKFTFKVSFSIFANFSFLKPFVLKNVSKYGSFSYDGNYRTENTFNTNGLVVNGNIEIIYIIFKESKTGGGFYDIEIIIKYPKPENISPIGELPAFHFLPSIEKIVFEKFKLMATINSRVVILSPSTLSIFVKEKEEWKKVRQCGGIYPPVYPCDADEFRNSINNNIKVLMGIEPFLEDDKNKRVINIYNIGLRLQNNYLHDDAFMCYYRIIEIISKFQSFYTENKSLFSCKRLFKRINKRKNNVKIECKKRNENDFCHISQRERMRIICLYLEKKYGLKKFVTYKSLLIMVKIRNNLSHGNEFTINEKCVNFCQSIAKMMIDDFIIKPLILI
jgi:hypothetical protein